jgi:hypothetical protein
MKTHSSRQRLRQPTLSRLLDKLTREPLEKEESLRDGNSSIVTIEDPVESPANTLLPKK